MNDSPVIFRPAIKADCGVIAQLYQISSDGVADYTWSNIAAADEDILDVGRRRHERENKLNKLSLSVFEKNSGAKRLYERLGYREVAREVIFPYPLIHFTGDAILMVRETG